MTETRPNFTSLTGKGVTGTVDGRQVALGNRQLLEDARVDPDPGAAPTACAAKAKP